jgi:cystathionine beta-lyase/cystathionine gamma-synthase
MATGALLEPIWAWRKNLGQAPAPQTAALLARSIRTLGVRVRQQNASSLLIARAMEAHPRIARVFHPGLESSPGHQLAARQMSGFGGMLSIEIDGTGADASAMVDRLKLFAIAPSLGGVESLVTQPVTTTHHDLVPEDRMRRGISDSLVRLSVGLEDVQDILADLYQAID